jgi:hypothetical protein
VRDCAKNGSDKRWPLIDALRPHWSWKRFIFVNPTFCPCALAAGSSHDCEIRYCTGMALEVTRDIKRIAGTEIYHARNLVIVLKRQLN